MSPIPDSPSPTTSTTLAPIPEDPSASAESDLIVTFNPPLYLQRRMWILDHLREQNAKTILDAGCSTGELLEALSQPAPWLEPPPPDLIPTSTPSTSSTSPSSSTSTSPSPPHPTPSPPPSQGDTDAAIVWTDPSTFGCDTIKNLHPTLLHGLDISDTALDVAAKNTAPPPSLYPPQPSLTHIPAGERVETDPNAAELDLREDIPPPFTFTFTLDSKRWEPLTTNLWQGNIDTINPAFINVECIVSSEVIEHLPPHTLPYFAPTLLGIYHPRTLLLTTPSYTFNARFSPPTPSIPPNSTSPSEPSTPPSRPCRRGGFPDPTNRTTRIFRHPDHYFEFTTAEFAAYCEEAGKEWGYDAEVGSIGRATEVDPWGRDEELGGATGVCVFRRRDGVEPERDAGGVEGEWREARARRVVAKLDAERGVQQGAAHILHTQHTHPARPSAGKPKSVDVIGARVLRLMQSTRVGFMRLAEIFYETDSIYASAPGDNESLSDLCGGYIELLIYAIDTHPGLILKRPTGTGAAAGSRDDWVVELVLADGERGGLVGLMWPSTEGGSYGGGEYLAPDWSPVEEPYVDTESDTDGGSGSEQTAAEGDVSWNDVWSAEGDEDEGDEGGWGAEVETGWGCDSGRGWGVDEKVDVGWNVPVPVVPPSSAGSVTGWDGDDDESEGTS